MGKIVKITIAILIFSSFYRIPVQAQDSSYLESYLYDMEGLEAEMSRIFPDYHIDLEVMMQRIMKGEIKEAAADLWNELRRNMNGEFSTIRNLLISILVMGIVSALFTSLGDLMTGRQIAQVGFYMIYLLLMALLTRAFQYAAQVTTDTIENIITFIRLFVPTYFIAVGTAVGVTTATVSYQFVLVVIYAVEAFMLNALMPFIYCYMMLSLVNGIWSEDKLTLLLDLIKKGIGFTFKIAIGIITGISFIQSVITPAIDGVKSTGIQKAISVIPGIGDFMEGVAEMIVGSAVLIKNSVGVLLLLLLLLVCAAPVIKLAMIVLVMKFSAALIGMVSEKRIANGVNRVGDASFLLLQATFTAVSLFFIIIAIAAYTTR